MVKEVYCRGCKRRVEVPRPSSQGHPYGWYTLSVGVPPDMDRRSYRYIGLFCSVGCLVSYEDDLIAGEELMRGVYDRE